LFSLFWFHETPWSGARSAYAFLHYSHDRYRFVPKSVGDEKVDFAGDATGRLHRPFFLVSFEYEVV
jgi:hypothetical protein